MSFPKIDGYVVTEKLGSGSYSTVYKAYTKIGARTTVAVKCIDKSRIKHSGAAVVNLVTEIRLLKSLTHPHIVHMKEFTWDDRNIYIIMEYCCGGDLSKYIRRYGRVPEKQVLYFLQQLASALKFLRDKGVVHMDLKPHNLLLHRDCDGRHTLKVADFGFAQHMAEQPARTVRGSPLYMAPEMLLGEYDARVDLWSVGVIMYECLFGRAPYSSATFAELMDKIQRQAPIEVPASAGISAGCRELLARLLRHQPDQRISYEEFFAHPYLDLDHMPSKENYNKAVALIKRAIELECSGRLAEALQAYGDSLLYLVPAVGAESDAVRRSALAAKLRQYMDRAEEIKRIVTGQASVPSAAPPSHDSVVHSPQACDTTVHCTHNEDIQTDKTDVDIQTDKNTSEPAAKAQDRRGALARLLRRPVPYLDRDTSEGVPEKPQKNNEANDTCKIT
ncbi:serine/threonine-protein kinase ULK3 isoform X2 [Bicyclus anynana]|uniref:Serine/threonine-protein kinase ULK3 n=1 Tax=Bicyclus anynana TaxID=110368 RepID=A0A6J1N1T2_BICAN|nr:serine/threonine-protein kinase ULK3 isoform X2 [Bicyclus anynana]